MIAAYSRRSDRSQMLIEASLLSIIVVNSLNAACQACHSQKPRFAVGILNLSVIVPKIVAFIACFASHIDFWLSITSMFETVFLVFHG